MFKLEKNINESTFANTSDIVDKGFMSIFQEHYPELGGNNINDLISDFIFYKDIWNLDTTRIETSYSRVSQKYCNLVLFYPVFLTLVFEESRSSWRCGIEVAQHEDFPFLYFPGNLFDRKCFEEINRPIREQLWRDYDYIDFFIDRQWTKNYYKPAGIDSLYYAWCTIGNIDGLDGIGLVEISPSKYSSIEKWFPLDACNIFPYQTAFDIALKELNLPLEGEGYQFEDYWFFHPLVETNETGFSGVRKNSIADVIVRNRKIENNQGIVANLLLNDVLDRKNSLKSRIEALSNTFRSSIKDL